MPTMTEVRSKYPQYADMSDADLATALHQKFYSDMPFDAFASKIGVTPKQEVPGAMESAAISAGSWLDRKAAGLREAVPAPVRNGLDWVNNKLGMGPVPTVEGVAQNDKTLEPVREAHPVASFVGNTAPDFAVTNPVSMAAMAALDPGSVGDRAMRAATTFGVAKVGQKVGGAIADKLANRAATQTADLAAQKAQNSVRDATMAGAQEAGYVLPPSQVNPSTLNRLAEGFAGKLTTAQNAAAKNQNVTNTLIKKEIGLPQDAPLTLETIRAARAEAGKAYEPVRNFGEMPADEQYASALNDIASKYDKGHGGMASLRNPQVESLLADASQLKLDSHNAVDFLQNLREQGFANASPLAAAADRKLGKTQLGIANAVEDLMDRNLSNAGQADALQAFRDARVRMAKTYTAEKALNPATGNIDASKIGAMFKKDKPLTGGFATVGRTAAAFPAATKEITTSLPQVSPLDYAGGMMAGTMTGNPLSALAPLARPVVRSAILSKQFQGLLSPSYNKGAMGKMVEGAGNSPEAMRRIGGLLGMLGLRANQ
jgi:hypothetical protein